MYSFWPLVFLAVSHHSALRADAGPSNLRGSLWTVAPPVVWGSPWPMPQVYTVSTNVLALRYRGFQFNAVGQTCDILDDAFDRYYKLMFETPTSKASDGGFRAKVKGGPDYKGRSADGEITGLSVYVQNPCDAYPTLESDESYKISITPGNATLSATSLWGALRGLETFSQIVYETSYESHNLYLVNETQIVDYPRFAHRGLLLDTSRHYIEKNIIMQVLEAMAQSKLNVFHWHIVDDESFPYRSRAYPSLSSKGAFEPYTHVYDGEDVRDIIEFARRRGIRVVPEFDTPGHTQSWGKGQANLLTPCYDSSGNLDGTFGPVNPITNDTYQFITTLFKEVLATFPDTYIHLGGDEVDFGCWKSNPNVTQWMKAMGFGSDYAQLESYYMQNILDIVNKLGSQYKPVVWQDVFDNGDKISLDTVVHVWKDMDEAGASSLSQVTAAGHQALLSSCWYLNFISTGEDWHPFYACDPQKFSGTDAQKDLVIGGEACMWGEYIDGTNIMTRTWPRASVVAERLWSSANLTDFNAARPRLETQRCRMLMRGLSSEPINGAGYCRYEQQGVAPVV